MGHFANLAALKVTPDLRAKLVGRARIEMGHDPFTPAEEVVDGILDELAAHLAASDDRHPRGV